MPDEGSSFLNLRFENDVKTYSIQTQLLDYIRVSLFENDVKTYSIQTVTTSVLSSI